MTLNTRHFDTDGNMIPGVTFGAPAPTPASPIILPKLQTRAVPPNAPWKHISEVRKIGYDYVANRYNNLINSFRSPWTSINEAGIDGFEWGSVNVIGGRPGGGKTAMVNQMTRTGWQFNPGQNYSVLDFQFEMTARNTAVREFSTIAGKSVKSLLSADKSKPMTQNDLDYLDKYINKHSNDAIYQIENPMTVDEMENWLYQFYDYMQLPVIATVDHSILVRKGKGENGKQDTLYELGEMVTRAKKNIPSVIFFILTQMNREIEKMERRNPHSVGNYPMTSDVFGADALLQHCDSLMVLNKPADYNIGYYGPDSYVVSPDLVACHLLKMRAGEKGIVFFESDYGKMQLNETIPAKQGQSKSSGGSISTANISTNQPKYTNKNRPSI